MTPAPARGFKSSAAPAKVVTVDHVETKFAQNRCHIDPVVNRVFQGRHTGQRAAAYMIRRDLLRLRTAVVPLVEVCRRLGHAEVIAIDAAMQPLFRDVTDHILRVQEEINSLREVLAFAFEASLMTGQAQQTAITRKLAAWVAILAVPTAIAGIYGMHFEHMPELKWRYGYFS